jgi:hypothetical protein
VTHVRTRRWAALPVLASLSLTALVALPAAPAAAAQGDVLGYLSDSPSGTRYVAYDSAGTQVASSPPGAVDGAVGAVVNGHPTVAYVEEVDSGTSYVDRLHVIAPDGTDTLVYSAPTGSDVGQPAIAPNGRDVLFTLDDDTTSAILDIDAPSRALRTIRSSTSTAYYGPSFSPDGQYLSWAQESRFYSDVVIARFSTGAATILTEASVDNAIYSDTSWSPDSAQVVAERDAYDQYVDDLVGTVQVVDVRTHETRIAVHGGQDSSGSVIEYVEPTWATDGQNLLMTKLTETQTATTGELVSLPPNQGGMTEPVPTTHYAGSPSTAAPNASDSTAPAAPQSIQAQGAGSVAHVSFILPPDSDLADLVVTRVEGAPADTATADIEVARVWSGAVDVPLPAADTTYGISVFARDWSGNLSPAAKVSVTSAPAATLTTSTPRTRINWREGVKLTGTLTGPSPLANEKVTMYVRRALTSTFVAVASSYTNANGDYTLTYNPQWTAEYQVRFAGSPRAYPADSPKRVVTVVPAANFLINSSTPIKLGRSWTLSGNVGPNHPGQIVYVQRRVNGIWRSIASARLSSTSTYRLVLKPNARGTWVLRAYKPADGDHASTVSRQGYTLQVS